MLSVIPIVGPVLLHKRSDRNPGEARNSRDQDRRAPSNTGARTQQTSTGEVPAPIDNDDGVWKMISQYMNAKIRLYAKDIVMATVYAPVVRRILEYKKDNEERERRLAQVEMELEVYKETYEQMKEDLVKARKDLEELRKGQATEEGNEKVDNGEREVMVEEVRELTGSPELGKK